MFGLLNVKTKITIKKYPMGNNSKRNIYRIIDTISSTLQHNIRKLYPAITNNKHTAQPGLQPGMQIYNTRPKDNKKEKRQKVS